MNRFVFKSTQYAMKTKLLHDVKNKTFKHEIVHAKGKVINVCLKHGITVHS